MRGRKKVKVLKKLTAIEHVSEGMHVLCGYCNKPIHVKDFGGMSKEVGLFHMQCRNDAAQQSRKKLWNEQTA